MKAYQEEIKSVPILPIEDNYQEMFQKRIEKKLFSGGSSIVAIDNGIVDYSIQGGESFNQVQERGIKALEEVIQLYAGENMIIGTHGTWLAVMLNYYDEKYDLEFWKTLKMPDAFLLKFADGEMKSIERLTDILSSSKELEG